MSFWVCEPAVGKVGRGPKAGYAARPVSESDVQAVDVFYCMVVVYDEHLHTTF
ncbi:hypothetical protein D3C86_2004730 [compost metagenome]